MNNKKSITYFVTFFVMFGLVTGCTTSRKNEPAGPNNVAEEPITGLYAGEAEIGENAVKVEVPAFDFLQGGISYEVDSNNFVELLIDANATQDQILSLNAADGLVWTLTIPPNAVTENVLIKISALANIESDALGSLKAGVLLEPDGLEFSPPATLQIKGDVLGAHPLIFNGSHDGSEFDFANVTLIEGGVSATISHFSSAFADPLVNDASRTKAQQAASDGYKKIRDFALSFLKEKIYVPTPPAIPLRCAESEKIEQEREKVLKIFLQEFSMPEEAIAQMLLQAGRNDVILNNENNDSAEIAHLLMERLVEKANALYQAYYPKEEYYIAIARAGLIAERQFLLYGGASDTESFTAKIGQWARQIADAQLKALREQHDYQLLTTLLKMDRDATLLGNSKTGFEGEVKNALQFRVQYGLQVTIDAEVGNETISTQGIANYNGWNFENKSYYESGNGQYVGFEASWPEGLEASLNMPAKYTFDTRIENFDACRNFSFDLIINKLSDDTETYTYTDTEFGSQTTQTEGVVAAIAYTAFENEVVETMPGREGETFYKFTIPLQNLNATTGEMVIARTIPNCTATVNLQLVHTPK